MKKSTIKNLLNDLKYVMCAVLVVAFIGCMFPMTATYAFTGSESADDSSAFASVQEQNRYKVWSIFKTYGMTDAQVIGGSIDIAVITKHEGFKWIQRKHYYDKDLNLTTAMEDK